MQLSQGAQQPGEAVGALPVLQGPWQQLVGSGMVLASRAVCCCLPQEPVRSDRLVSGHRPARVNPGAEQPGQAQAYLPVCWSDPLPAVVHDGFAALLRA